MFRHRFGQIGLARPGGTFEQHPSARVPAEHVSERGVPEEHVQGPNDLVRLPVEAFDLVETNLDLLGADQHVRRTAIGEGHENEGADQHEQQEDGKQQAPVGGEVREPDWVSDRGSIPEERIEAAEEDQRTHHPADA